MRWIALAALAALFSGCVTAKTTVTNASLVRPPTQKESFAIYFDPSEIPGPFEKLALISMKDASDFGDVHYFRAAQEAAAELGADGVLIDSINKPDMGQQITNIFLPVGAWKTAQAWAVRLRSKPQPQPRQISHEGPISPL